jgi:hypothetical protein
MKVVNDKERPSGNAVPRKTLDDWEGRMQRAARNPGRLTGRPVRPPIRTLQRGNEEAAAKHRCRPAYWLYWTSSLTTKPRTPPTLEALRIGPVRAT